MGYSTSEIAEMMGLKQGAVLTRLHRARHKLKDSVEQTVNCEQDREAIPADPAFDGGASHVAGCSGCQAYQREMQSLNLKIAKAMLIDVPELKMPELPDVDTSKV